MSCYKISFFVGLFLSLTSFAQAAPQCGNSESGFQNWLEETKADAAKNGIGKLGIAALNGLDYANATIYADRHQKSFKLSLSDFMKKRGSATIVARGKIMKKQNASLFKKIEKKYGVPAGPLIAVWGMETNFGSYMGKQHTLSALATLAYDCRRSEFFTEQLYAALTLIQNGDFDEDSIGAMHGEIGQTQFLPKNVLLYGVDGDGNGHIDMIRSRADALASTANFLKGHGFVAGKPYQKKDSNFEAIKGWNAASVYQEAIAIMGKQIDDD